jgi:hypothetical protein
MKRFFSATLPFFLLVGIGVALMPMPAFAASNSATQVNPLATNVCASISISKVQSWYGNGIVFHLPHCFVQQLSQNAYSAAAISTTIAAACFASIIGNIGCSQIAGIVAGALVALGPGLGIWDKQCSSRGISMVAVLPEWWHGAWAYPQC